MYGILMLPNHASRSSPTSLVVKSACTSVLLSMTFIAGVSLEAQNAGPPNRLSTTTSHVLSCTKVRLRGWLTVEAKVAIQDIGVVDDDFEGRVGVKVGGNVATC